MNTVLRRLTVYIVRGTSIRFDGSRFASLCVFSTKLGISTEQSTIKQFLLSYYKGHTKFTHKLIPLNNRSVSEGTVLIHVRKKHATKSYDKSPGMTLKHLLDKLNVHCASQSQVERKQVTWTEYLKTHSLTHKPYIVANIFLFIRAQRPF